MGTNYYLRHPETPLMLKMKQRPPEIHLGKSSMGWTFSFQGDREEGVIDLKSWRERITRLLAAGALLEDEGGEEITLDKLTNLIAKKIKEPNNHAKRFGAPDNWLDAAGNSFTGSWFS